MSCAAAEFAKKNTKQLKIKSVAKNLFRFIIKNYNIKRFQGEKIFALKLIDNLSKIILRKRISTQSERACPELWFRLLDQIPETPEYEWELRNLRG